MILVIDTATWFRFECSTEEGAACYARAIKLMGHIPLVVNL